jgi:GTP-binding protein YchF
VTIPYPGAKSMGFQCGIVGLPNVGKSTIFNALTSAGAEAANFPFCTKDPNIGMVNIPDGRLQELAVVHKPKKITPSVMQFVDIAGLVRGAAQGEGLGNQFLSHIREVDAIMHVVRCFEDVDITHVEGNVDPVRDVDTVNMELILRDMDTVDKKLAKDKKLSGQPSKEGKEAKARVSILEKLHAGFDAGRPARAEGLEPEEKLLIQDLGLLTLKPMFYCANLREDEWQTGNAHLDALQAYATSQNSDVLTISGKIESEIAEIDPAEKPEFMAALGMEESGLDRVIRKGFAMLGLQTYFTAGEQEVRAWTIPVGSRAPQAAGVIHSDFERGFICAETLGFADFRTHGTWQAAKEKGLVRTEGKVYVMRDGDIVHFLFNV